MSENDVIERLREDIHAHGEVHAVVEEAGAGEFDGEEVELRLGTTEFDVEAGLVTVDDGRTLHRFSVDSIVRWYLPVEFTHG